MNSPEKEITYLALGDSYTMGEKIKRSECWPIQLVKKLSADGHQVLPPTIIAENGWTTQDLLSAMSSELKQDKYDLVSVLIGVNNQFDGKSIEDYKSDLHELFTKAIAQCSQGKKGVFALSIPDYSVTPFAKSKKINSAEELAKFNAVYKAVSTNFGIDFYNITPISRQAEKNENLLAEDLLHPSGLMYANWVNEIFDEVCKKLP